MSVFDAIAELIAERNDCAVTDITEDSRFEDLGIDSLDTVEMMMDLEDKLQAGVELELTEKVETVGELAAFVERVLEENK